MPAPIYVTGFGILGHLLEVSPGCKAKLIINYGRLPFYPATLDIYKKET